MSDHDKSIFMELPMEIRDMILRFLLVAPYTKLGYDRMRTKDYSSNKQYLRKGPDQTYKFFTAIMSTNRRIYAESVNLCQRENYFVCLTSSQPSRLARRLEEHGMQTIAQGPKAHDFWNIAMTIKLDPADFAGWPGCRSSDAEEDRPWKYIFCVEEMPTFCRLLLKLNKHSRGHLLPNTTIHISIKDACKGLQTEIDRDAVGLFRMQKLLDPLYQLHSFGAAQIEGPLSSSHKDVHIKSLCKACPTAIEIIQSAMVILSQGDQLIGLERPCHAVEKYKIALSHVRSCCWLYDDRHFIMDSGPFPGLKAAQVMRNLKVRLLARIASAHLKSGMLRMARIYVERALHPRRGLHHAYNRIDTFDLLDTEEVVYAEVLLVSAGIYYTHGHVSEAMGDLLQAHKYQPLSEEEQCRYKAWDQHALSLRQRDEKRLESREKQREKEERKAEEKFLVVCNWTRKGDRLLRSGRSDLATSTYQTALSKIGSRDIDHSSPIRSGEYQDYAISDGIRNLSFRLQASITASYLMSQRYKDAINSSENFLKDTLSLWSCSHRREHSDGFDGFLCRICVECQRVEIIRVRYCYSRALMHMGNTLRAIEQMKLALVLDPGDGTVAAQLMLLRRKLGNY